MKLAVVGSRSYKHTNPGAIYSTLDYIYKHDYPDLEIISGGAEGIDSIAWCWARDRNVPITVFRPNWTDLSHEDAIIKTGRNGVVYDANAGFRRNSLIVDNCDLLVAWWNGKSRGTADSIEKARKAGKLWRVYT